MKANKDFIIPFSSLSLGTTKFEMKINKEFFDQFEYSLVRNGNLDVKLDFTKQETMLILNFKIQGYIMIECDRCLADMPYPVNIEERQLIKINDSLADEEQNDNEEIIYMSRGAYEYDVSSILYELMSLQVPLFAQCDGQQDYCDQEMLDTLESYKSDNDDDQDDNSPWNELKKLK